jgi:SAM-dependent methyltransferase
MKFLLVKAFWERFGASVRAGLRTNTHDPARSERTAFDTKDILSRLASLNDQDWLEVLIRSINVPAYQGMELPRFPPDELQRQFVGSAGENTIREAFTFYRVVKDYAARLGKPLAPRTRVLDFGCGWGRIIRVFLRDVYSENLYGVDVVPTVIDICKQTFPYGTFSVVEAWPPTAFNAETFDCIYAYSVFSHLAEPVHIKWVEEFSRILKPGGVLLVTTQGRSFIEFCRSLREKEFYEHPWYEVLAKSFVDTNVALANYDDGKFVYSATGGGDFMPSRVYGEAVIPRAYVKREWIKFLVFRDFIDDRSFLPQALIVMQKSV